jgi:hypothetical protein
VVLATVALAIGAPGCMSTTTTTGVTKTHRPGDALRPAAAPVPPTQEIEVLDPNLDPTGKPTVVRTGATLPPDVPFPAPLPPIAPPQQLDVPPAILVHKFYYTGNRTFQAQLLPGGPVIVSVNHPRTLERVYVPVTLPPGAPRVTYTGDSICYEFGPQSVTLIFGPCGNPRVRYGQSTNATETVRKKAEAAHTEAQSWVQRTGLPQGIQRFKESAKSTCGAVADRLHDAGKMVVDAVGNAIQFIPGAQWFRSSPEDAAVREQERLQRAAETTPSQLNQFVPRAP